MASADREGLARAVDPHAFVWPAAPERRAQALAKADEFLAPLAADIARLSAEVEARDKALLILLAFADRAAGEGIAFLGSGSPSLPHLDAADICKAAATALGMDLCGPEFQALTERATAHVAALAAGQDKTGGGKP